MSTPQLKSINELTLLLIDNYTSLGNSYGLVQCIGRIAPSIDTSKLLADLEEKSLIRKNVDKQMAIVDSWQLTQKGKAVAQSINVNRLLKEFYSNSSDTLAASLLEQLKKMYPNSG